MQIFQVFKLKVILLTFDTWAAGSSLAQPLEICPPYLSRLIVEFLE
jgi:hypothetical protein